MNLLFIIIICFSFYCCNLKNDNSEESSRNQDSLYKNFVDSVFWRTNSSIPDKEKHVMVKEGAKEYHFEKFFSDSKGDLVKYFSYNVNKDYTNHQEFYYLDDQLILVRLMKVSDGDVVYKSGYYFKNNTEVWNYMAGNDPNTSEALVLRGMMYLNLYKKGQNKK